MRLGGTFAGRQKAAVGKAFYVKELRGRLFACKWPTKRGRPLHPTTLEQNEKFKQANKMAQFAPAAVQMAHRKMVEGTNLLPRDLMISAMMGRGFRFIIPNQQKRYPVAARQDLSDTLDILGALAGDVIARGPELWERVRPPMPGHVLTSNLEGELPSWQAPATGAGLWSQVGDYTVPSTLPLNDPVIISIPANWQEIEIQAEVPWISGGVRMQTQFNTDTGASYTYAQIFATAAAAVNKETSTGISGLRWLPQSVTPFANNLVHEMRIVQKTAAHRAMVKFSTGTQYPLTSTGGGTWANGASAWINRLMISSVAGNGVPLGTRIITRAIVATP